MYENNTLELKKAYYEKTTEHSLWLFTATLATWSVGNTYLQALALFITIILSMKLFNQLEDMENTISNNSLTEKVKLLFRKEALPLLLVLAFVFATVMNFSLQLAELL